MKIRMTKHEGLGNDFLVLFTDQPLPRLAWSRMAVQLCDRRRGVGADGLLLVAPIDGGWRMTLVNADGSEAEISGNGIRCVAQAVWMRTGGEGPAAISIDTAAGPRSVLVEPTDHARTVLATVDMGAVVPIAEPDGWDALGCDPMRPVTHVSMGNPHSVVGVDDVHAVPLGELGALVPQVNLEVVAPTDEPSTVRMRVHERGAGITEACGSGACATAFAARAWGLAHGDAIVVRMDGGDATVRFEGDRAILIGPATYVADVEAVI
jgi:diaminopimelate epimerase